MQHREDDKTVARISLSKAWSYHHVLSRLAEYDDAIRTPFFSLASRVPPTRCPTLHAEFAIVLSVNWSSVL